MKTMILYVGFYLFFEDFIYLFDRETASESGNTSPESEKGRSRLPAEQGARCGVQLQDPGIAP